MNDPALQPKTPQDNGYSRFDVDFSLAIHNRTGKYFIGRDLIEGVPERIGRIYFWLLPLRAPPGGSSRA